MTRLRGSLAPATGVARAVLAALAVCTVLATPAFAAVDDPDTVDALQARPGKPFVYMLIVQDRPWDGDTHVMIGNKLGGYLRYALGGQLVRDNPEAAGMPVRIVIVAEQPTTERDDEILEQFREQTRAAGIDLVWGGESNLLTMVHEE